MGATMLESTKDQLRKMLDERPMPHVHTYNSFGEYLEHAAKVPSQHRNSPIDGTYSDFIGKARIGSHALGEQAQQKIDELDNEGLLSVGPSALGPSVVGFTPIVPAALIGHPESMLARTVISSNRSPIRILFGIGAGGWASEEAVRNRGIAITALILALQAFRPVEAWAWTANAHPSNSQQVSFRRWPIDMAPLDLASLAFQATHHDMHLSLGFSLSDWDNGTRGENSHPFPYSGKRDFIAQVARVAFECEETDLVIPRAIGNSEDPLLNSPWEWLKETIEMHKSGEALEGLTD